MASIDTGIPAWGSGAGAASTGLGQSTRSQLQHSAGEFESILLTQWLQGAEDSFGTVPGAEEDQDAAGDQIKNFAVQALAKAFTQAGGIGISQMVAKALGNSSSEKTAIRTEK